MSEDEAPASPPTPATAAGEGMEIEPPPASTVGPPAEPATPGADEVGRICEAEEG
jgi:hypothetical protein